MKNNSEVKLISRIARTAWWIFGLFSAIILVFGISEVYRVQTFLATAQRAEASVTDVEKTNKRPAKRSSGYRYDYILSLSFTTQDGATIQTKKKGTADSAIEDTLPIFYDPKNPAEVIIDEWQALYMGWIMMAYGLLITVTLGVALYYPRYIRKKRTRLMEVGTKVEGTFVRFDRASRFTNKFPRYFIIVEAIDPLTSQKRLYKSKKLDFNRDLPKLANKTFAIYINPNQPSDYHVDVASVDPYAHEYEPKTL